MEIQLWREILDPYSLAVNELIVKFNHIIEEYRRKGSYSPIELVTGRVKTISSILEKAQKKNIALDDIEEKIDDIAGIRIICQFVEDIYKVVDIIRHRSDMTIKSEKDYIEKMKKSGYRSYHIIVYYDVETLKGSKRLQVEIQIRTLAMNFWATIEHSLQYKYKQNIPEHIRKRLSSAAEAILILDREMSVVRDEIMDAQNSFTIKANMVADILNNIQNLYKVANKQEVIKIQDEFFRIYQDGDKEELEKFSKNIDLIAQQYRAQSLH
ncbi:GTP pyrophosphokinase [Herbinix luporum]|jgi:putative GTP pyrophosphokinase|uniref:GTP pyrophosphokinase YjbM n=1 Tax=Herbinix luporum TaxID=1679721 RepID=A0A0K8J531_9FIRM|nr:GTP pyrophosphokinase family protein [Herbinix luporum]MDI9488798.1 GTP pyrophosphokinase family protein [Bacillota bacterium]CUH92585.1 GTP pyrophosphokinase YjbM [Herbinix luporum]HHT56776.1 GTP pyrophosphokinase family protein [Herbinix luporum]